MFYFTGITNCSTKASTSCYKWLTSLVYIVALLLVTIQQAYACTATTIPETFVHTMTLNGETISVNFTKFSNRGPNFAVLEQQANGTLANHTPSAVRTYMGSVTGRSGAIAAGLCRADGSVLANVIFEDGVEWLDRGTAVITPEFDPYTPKFPGNIVRNGGAGSTLYGAELGIDLPNVQVVRSGGTTATALEIAEFSTMSMNLVYFRDVAIFHRIGRVIVRLNAAADPYAAVTGNSFALLDEITNQWENVLLASTHDLALAVSPNFGGGVAMSATVGIPGYSANGSAEITGDFSAVARHEVGHNWSINHFDGGTPEGPTINSGNDLAKMSGPEMGLVLTHRTDRLASLDNLGTFATAVPPRAADERITVEPIGGSIPIDVLVNDNDTNGTAVSILSFDAATQKGLTVTQNGNSLIVQAPSDFSSGDDFFRYRIQDADAMTSTAVVHLRSVLAGNGLGHWTFENSPTRAFDSSSRASHGTLAGDASINVNGELVLDGQGDFASVPPPNVTTNSVTYSAFVFRNGNQAPGAGIVLGSPTDNSSGLRVEGAGNELGYSWNGFFNSGLIIPDQTWTFVALVIEPNLTTLYMDSGTGMQSASNVETNPPKTLTGFFQLGADPDADPNVANPPFWKGRLDDVRVENRSLSAAEIAALATRDLGARNPTPFHTGTDNNPTTTMTWTPAQNMTQQRVYFSNSYTEVRDGTVGGVADQGVVTANSFQQNGLADGSYYWRIDSTEPIGVVQGNIWTFVVSDSIPDITSPVPGTTLGGLSQTFTWNYSGVNVDQWALFVGGTVGGSEHSTAGATNNATTTTINGLPTDGSTIYVRLWYRVGTVWSSVDVAYTAATIASNPPAITSPVPGTTLDASSQTFTWNYNGVNVGQWALYAGSTVGGNEYSTAGAIDNATTTTISGLPTDGSIIYVRLWYRVGTVWSSVDVTYTTATIASNPAIASPVPGTTLGGLSQTFTWNYNGVNVDQWALFVGGTVGGSEHSTAGATNNATTTTINGLPTDGSIIYVRLWYRVGTVWNKVDATYAAATMAAIASPAPCGTLSSMLQTFTLEV